MRQWEREDEGQRWSEERHWNMQLQGFHLRGSFPWARLSSGPLHPGGFYLGWGQGPTPSTAFGDRMGSSPPPGVEPMSMTIGPQSPYQVSYLIPSIL
ncbi:hypothetical protein IGI04_007523 [Brassica rapa subsp. trilocularis]|uniref:Uncharacterized protein n=1 Tax=Brassica rapa subsp. trilocularis TaxID=1813537 RepID=A0ABQ7NK36_BRACM|nr:hypothetical protein IGI04_007523 [Brassica rapa subsp. trilocularis]